MGCFATEMVFAMDAPTGTVHCCPTWFQFTMKVGAVPMDQALGRL